MKRFWHHLLGYYLFLHIYTVKLHTQNMKSNAFLKAWPQSRHDWRAQKRASVKVTSQEKWGNYLLTKQCTQLWCHVSWWLPLTANHVCFTGRVFRMDRIYCGRYRKFLNRASTYREKLHLLLFHTFSTSVRVQSQKILPPIIAWNIVETSIFCVYNNKYAYYYNCFLISGLLNFSLVFWYVILHAISFD